jgi:hypothetical protein
VVFHQTELRDSRPVRQSGFLRTLAENVTACVVTITQVGGSGEVPRSAVEAALGGLACRSGCRALRWELRAREMDIRIAGTERR